MRPRCRGQPPICALPPSSRPLRGRPTERVFEAFDDRYGRRVVAAQHTQVQRNEIAEEHSAEQALGAGGADRADDLSLRAMLLDGLGVQFNAALDAFALIAVTQEPRDLVGDGACAFPAAD